MIRIMKLPTPFTNRIQNQLTKDEVIIWQGEPKPKFSFTLLELGGHYDAMTGLTSIFGFVLAGIIFFGYRFYTTEKWLLLILTLIIGGLILIIPDVIKHKRKQNTKYVVTNRRVFFRLWNFGKVTIHSIELQHIAKITMELYKDKSGILHFLPEKPFGFYTKDFISGEKRHYPTFEMIENVQGVHEQLEFLQKKLLK